MPSSSWMRGSVSRAGGTSMAWPSSTKPRCMSPTRSAVRPGSRGSVVRNSSSRCSGRSFTSSGSSCFRSARLRLCLALPRAHGERVGDVPDRLDRALVVEDHRDDVEAAGDLPQPLELEIAVGELAEPVLLAGVDRGLGWVALHVPPRLHLNEDEGLALLRHEVDLPRAGADVAFQDCEAAAGQEAGGLLFPSLSGDLSSVGRHVHYSLRISVDPLQLGTGEQG